MPDFDVSAEGLASPPANAYLQTYTPAIRVKNNGVHVTDVIGTIAIFDADAGAQVFSGPISLPNLSPGATDSAPAASPWTPGHSGKYYAYGFATTGHDANPQNGQLPPSWFTVAPGPPAPPVTVPAHAAQHESGGADELRVTGLIGRLEDPQQAEPHASSHQNGGDDQISIDGLTGQAATDQPPMIHGNTKHNPTMATESALSNHESGTTEHSAATNLANREITGARTGLVKESQLVTGTLILDPGDDPNTNGIRADAKLGATLPIHHAAKHTPLGYDPVLSAYAYCKAERNITAYGDSGLLAPLRFILQGPLTAHQPVGHIAIIGSVSTAAGAGQHLIFQLWSNSGSRNLLTLDVPVAALTVGTFHYDFDFAIMADQHLAALAHGELTPTLPPLSEIHNDVGLFESIDIGFGTWDISLLAGWTGAPHSTVLLVSNIIGSIIAQLS